MGHLKAYSQIDSNKQDYLPQKPTGFQLDEIRIQKLEDEVEEKDITQESRNAIYRIKGMIGRYPRLHEKQRGEHLRPVVVIPDSPVEHEDDGYEEQMQRIEFPEMPPEKIPHGELTTTYPWSVSPRHHEPAENEEEGDSQFSTEIKGLRGMG